MGIAQKHLRMLREKTGLPMIITSTRATSEGFVIGFRAGKSEELHILVDATGTLRELHSPSRDSFAS
jgi:hypothetical protein